MTSLNLTQNEIINLFIADHKDIVLEFGLINYINELQANHLTFGE